MRQSEFVVKTLFLYEWITDLFKDLKFILWIVVRVSKWVAYNELFN